MTAGIALPMSPVVAELDKVISECLASFPRPAVQSEVETYMMPAAREANRPPVESCLQDGGELTGAWPASVPREQQPLYEEAAHKGLHDLHQKVQLPVPQTCNEAETVAHKEAIVGIQKFTEVVIELSNLNESSKVPIQRFCEPRLEIKSGENALVFTKDTGISVSVLDDAAERVEFAGADEKSTLAHLIANEGHKEAVNDSGNAHVIAPESFDVSRGNGWANADDHSEVCKVGEHIVLRTECAEALEEISHTTEFSKVSEEQKSDQTCKSVVKGFGESKLVGRIGLDQNEFEGNVAGKESIENGLDVGPARDPAIDVELKEKLAANIETLENVQNAAVVHRSFSFSGLNHVAFCVESLERSLQFYCDLLGLKTSLDRPDLPYNGAWLFLGAEGIHLMEVPNPDPVNGRPAHGGWDRHACLNCKNVEGVRLALEKQGISYQRSPVPSIFTRDPDGNGLEFIEVDP